MSNKYIQLFDRVDRTLIGFMADYGIMILRISLGIIFLWFGILKFFPDLSPAEELAAKTIEAMTFGIVQSNVSMPVLATWETLIGLGLITGKYMRVTLLLLFLQMPGTFLPLVLLPDVCFTSFPLGLTMEGQYIIKNLILISAALVVGGTVRHSKPEVD